MPYCPKCDMEFVEGITICSDCKGPLVESEEAYKKALEEQKEQALAAKAASMGFGDFTEDAPEIMPAEGGPADMEKTPARLHSAGVYVSSRQKCEDMRSSSSAFLLVGGAVLAFSAVCWAGIIRLPMSDGSRLFFQGVLTAMGLLFLFVSFRTRASIASLKDRIEEEERRTKEIIEWFLQGWDAGKLDQELLKEDPSLSEAELDLKRIELIQDHLITGQDLPDQAYADFLAEEIYGRLYQAS